MDGTNMDEIFRDVEAIKMDYKNHRGEIKERHLQPLCIYWGKTEYYPDYQWIMKAYDLEKKEERDFALNRFLPEIDKAIPFRTVHNFTYEVSFPEEK